MQVPGECRHHEETSCTSGKVSAMSTPTHAGAPGRTDDPTILWNEVVKARSVVAAQRHLPPRSSAIAKARLLAALEAYVASRTNLGRPIPYTLRDELRLRRLTRND